MKVVVGLVRVYSLKRSWLERWASPLEANKEAGKLEIEKSLGQVVFVFFAF